jgi:organic radical activating enzyme
MNSKMNSKTYCKMPFVGFQATHKYNRLCCAAKEPKNKLNTKDFWNSKYLEQVRKKMIAGEQLDECTGCYKDENKGKISLRNHYNARFKDWGQKETPTAMDLDFSTLCNLKCIMCGPDRSSQWSKELGQIEKSPISKTEIDELCSISENVKHLTIQGGEPSVMPEFEYYFQYLKDNNLIQNIEIDCISNLTNVNNKFYKLLSEFKNVNLDVSIDAYGDACNYIRFPSNFEKIEQNLLSLIDRKIQVNLQISLQTLSMYNFYDFLVWIHNINAKFEMKNKKIGLNLSFVTSPAIYDINFAPIKLKEKFLSDIAKFKSSYSLKDNLKFNMSIRNIEKTLLSTHTTDNWAELERNIQTLDQRRNIKVTNYIPDFHKYI